MASRSCFLIIISQHVASNIAGLLANPGVFPFGTGSAKYSNLEVTRVTRADKLIIEAAQSPSPDTRAPDSASLPRVREVGADSMWQRVPMATDQAHCTHCCESMHLG